MSKNFLIEAYRKMQQRLQSGFIHAGVLRQGSWSLDRNLQEDALGDAFCKLWCANYDPATREEGEKLLYAASRRRQISLWRSMKRHPQAPLTDIRIAEPPPDTEAEETYRQVWEIIQTQLTPLQVDILSRYDLNGESYSDIAKRLGMQEAAVRMQLSRARKKIREIYRRKNDE